MIKKILSSSWSMRHQFAKYFIIGISSVALDILSLIFLKEIAGIPAVWAVVINYPILLTYNFGLNKYWTFQKHSGGRAQLFRYLLLQVFNYVFSVTAMYIFHDKFGLDYRLVRVCSIPPMVAWNFFLYKYWVYQDNENGPIKLNNDLPGGLAA